MADNAREIVLDVLIDIDSNGTFSNIALDKALRKVQFAEKTERAYITRSVEGVTETRLLLDHIIGSFSKVKLNKMRPLIRNVLRLGTYEMLFMDSVPIRATISECVKIVKKHNMMNLSGFTNAILRNISRKIVGTGLEDYKEMAERLEKIGEIFDIKDKHIIYSVPKWLEEFFNDKFGEDKAKLIMRDSFRDKKLVIRANTSKISVDELTAVLKENNLETSPGRYSKNCIRIGNVDFVRRIPGYKAGLFSVQAESSASAVEALGIEKDMKVLDLCAAPGGKSCYAAELLKGTGKVISRDISDDKTEIISDNISRLELDNVEVLTGDATVFEESYEGQFDAVIADVPCSGLGVIGKKNDIKYRVKPEDFESLTEISREILKNAVRYLKDGGKLLFSTCTINPGENEAIAKELLECYGADGVKEKELNDSCGLNADNGFILEKISEKTFIQGIDETDGFYYALFKKRMK